MRILLIFQSGKRVVGDDQAMILPEHPENIIKRIDLSLATEAEIEQLRKDPFNDELLQAIQKRSKI